jgi:hypothetical protein
MFTAKYITSALPHFVGALLTLLLAHLHAR